MCNKYIRYYQKVGMCVLFFLFFLKFYIKKFGGIPKGGVGFFLDIHAHLSRITLYYICLRTEGCASLIMLLHDGLIRRWGQKGIFEAF